MKTSTATIREIASRHEGDPAEAGRSCQACGRPWPCDVRRIVLALALDGATKRTTAKAPALLRRAVTPLPASAVGRPAAPRRRPAAIAAPR